MPAARVYPIEWKTPNKLSEQHLQQLQEILAKYYRYRSFLRPVADYLTESELFERFETLKISLEQEIMLDFTKT